MQENNASDENTNSEPANQNIPVSTPPASGDLFHPEPVANPDSPAPEKPELLAIPPKPRKEKSKSGVLAVIIVLLLAAGGATAWWMTKDNAGDSNSQTTAKETQDIEVLKIGSGEGPASVYFPDEGLLGVQTVIDHQVYEGLVGFDKSDIVPLIAQSWANPDEKTWVFKIRPNIKFHTGKAVKAAEVKAALDGLKQYDFWSLFVSTTESIEATGELELTIKTKDPDALLLNRLAQAFISDVTAADKVGNNGTGAYQADTTAKNDEKSTTLVAFDGYHGGRAKTRKLVFSIFESDPELTKALKEKTVDIIETLPIPSVKEELKDGGFANVEFVAPGAFGIFMNQARSETSILKNKDIRLAVAQAVNRQALIDKVGNKNAPATQVIPKSLPGYDDSISFPAFDLAAAKASLTKAGYKNTPLEFVYIKELQLDAPILIEQLRAAGFNIKERAYEGDDTDKALDELHAGRYDLFAASYTSDISDARDLLGGLLSSTESSYNPINDPVFDKLLTDSDKVFDPTKRIEFLQQANKYILDNLAWVPLRNGTYISYYPKDVDIKIGFNGGGNLGVYYRKVGRIVQ